MATQMIFGTASNDYSVIDNGAAPTFPTLDITKEHIGYDTTTGTLTQMQNPFTNGTVPDPALFSSSAAVIGIVQKTNNVSTGSVASLAKAFTSNNVLGNTIIVTCGVGNGTAPTVSDSAGNTYAQVALGANSTTFEVAIFVATNIKAGANTVTVTNAGTAASIAMEIYEFSNLVITSNTAVVDSTATNNSTANATSPAVTVGQSVGSEFSVVAFGLGTAAQTITVGGSYTNDSGQQNPVTPAGLFSFVSASLLLTGTASSSPSASATAEPWAVAAATFKPVSTSKQTLVLNSPLSTRVFFKNPA